MDLSDEFYDNAITHLCLKKPSGSEHRCSDLDMDEDTVL